MLFNAMALNCTKVGDADKVDLLYVRVQAIKVCSLDIVITVMAMSVTFKARDLRECKVEILCIVSGREVTTLGLVLDIIGVLGLFRYGMPSDDYRKNRYVGGDVDEENSLNTKSRFALGLIIVGFALQIAGVYWSTGYS